MRYILFVRADCPFCTKAQALLGENDLEYKVVDFKPSQDSILNEIKDAYEWSTVPMVFKRDGSSTNFIGGYTDLVEYLKNE